MVSVRLSSTVGSRQSGRLEPPGPPTGTDGELGEPGDVGDVSPSCECVNGTTLGYETRGASSPLKPAFMLELPVSRTMDWFMVTTTGGWEA